MEDKPEKKIYAKLVGRGENLELKDIAFLPCDYILRCVDGPYEGKQIRIKDLGDEIIIGSDISCNFYLKDSGISLTHCKLTWVPNTVIYFLEDLNSELGTWLKISSLEDGFEIKENTIFKVFQHVFEITTNSSGNHILRILEGSKKGLEKNIDEESFIMIGKKGTEIELDMECSENHIYKIMKMKGRIFIMNNCEEMTDEGLFYRLHDNEKAIVRGGDIIKIGKSSFRIIVHNWGIFSEIGDRIQQEDRHCIIDDLRLFDELVIPFYAVYDGHGGVSCSLYVQKHFHHNLRDLIKSKNLVESKNFLDDLCSTIQEAIIYTDINYYDTETSSAIHHGSTCVFLFFIGHLVICCNLGDSISIIVRNDQKIYLSKDFRPSREKERIAARKGYVTNDGRLLGLISVSRSFGDWKYKDPKQQDILRKAISGKTVDFEEYLISNRAEFRILDYDPRIDKYIIIVSDGIFQHTPNSNVIFDTINKYLAMEKSEYSSLKNIPNVTDNIRLDLINNIYGDFNTKGKADNMTLILIHLQNDK